MSSKLNFRQRDFDNDAVTTGISVNPATTLGQAGGLRDALVLWSVGSDGGSNYQQEITADSGVKATSPLAQNALRAVLEMQDSVTGKTFKEFLPMPDLGKAADGTTNVAFVVEGGLTVFNDQHADWTVLKTAIDARWLSPDGNAGTLQRAYIEE